MKQLVFIVLLSGICLHLHAQHVAAAPPELKTFQLKPVHLLPSQPAKGAIPPVVDKAPQALAPVSPSYYYSNCFGYFCKREWQIQKTTGLPLKFRLGDYSTTDRIEYKRY